MADLAVEVRELLKRLTPDQLARVKAVVAQATQVSQNFDETHSEDLGLAEVAGDALESTGRRSATATPAYGRSEAAAEAVAAELAQVSGKRWTRGEKLQLLAILAVVFRPSIENAQNELWDAARAPRRPAVTQPVGPR